MNPIIKSVGNRDGHRRNDPCGHQSGVEGEVRPQGGCEQCRGSGGRKNRLVAKADTLLQELKKSRMTSLVEAMAAQIMSRPDTKIEAWVRNYQNLLRKLKKDTDQGTLHKVFGIVHRNWEGGGNNQSLHANGPVRNVVTVV